MLIHDNTFTATSTPDSLIQFTEEEENNSSFFAYPRTVWPVQDQVMNSFIWNNTYNGAAIKGITVDPDYNSPNDFFQKDCDYFMHAPCGASQTTDACGNICTHGKESYTGTRYGGSTTYPTDGTKYSLDTGSMTFVGDDHFVLISDDPYTCKSDNATDLTHFRASV